MTHTTMPRALASVLLVASLAAACGSGTTPAAAPTAAETGAPDSAPAPVIAEATPSPEPEPEPETSLSDAQLAALGVNELGRVLVMEWHELQDENDRWANSMPTFRAQLEELRARGYRPISLDEFIDGTFDLEAGHSPVVLTFDDSYKEHLFFGPDGVTPDEDSVVGILQAMHEVDPTWRPLATFAFYWPYPFRETDRDLIAQKLRYLAENGFDLSNHTYNHDNLRNMTDDEVVANLARAEEELAAIVGPDHRVRSLTLTQGIWPNNRDLAMAGTTSTFTYEHDIALEVGYQPTKSPFHLDYDPRNVQRVQGWLPEFRKWMDWLDATPGRRLVSDGDAATVSFPESFLEVLGDTHGQASRSYAGEPQPSALVPATCVGEADGEPVPCATPGEPLDDADA